jgi:putative photosynthetic complex assembly protein
MRETTQVEKKAQHAEAIPRGVLFGGGALLAFALVMTFFGRTTDVGVVHMPATQPYQQVLLHFVDQPDGGIIVSDASSGAILSRVEPGTNGFLRGAVRGFARERARSGIGPETPFTLTRWNNGTLSLTDERTGRRVDLDAFGSTQSETFARLLAPPKDKAP